jgi:hypothetical protein
LIDKV